MKSVSLAVLMATLGTGVLAQTEDKPGVTSRSLVKTYEKIRQSFVREFRATTDSTRRVELLAEYSRKLNLTISEHAAIPGIARVLPVMAEARLLDLQPAFLAVFERNTKPEIKALSLYYLGRHFGNNRRKPQRDLTLLHLKKQYGSLKYRGETFARMADDASYYYKNLAVGCHAPATTGEDVDGQVFRLSDYRGKVVMLRFWGDWCPACRAMYPYERQVTQKYRNQPFALVGVNSDPRSRCRKAQQDSRLTWRSFWDGGNSSGTIARLYQVQHWPQIVIIDAEGIIRMNAQGLDEDYVSGLLDRLVKQAAGKTRPATVKSDA